MTSEASLRVPLDRFTDPPLAPPMQPASPARIGAPRLRLLTSVAVIPAAQLDVPSLPPEEWLRRIVLAILEVTHNKRATNQLRGIVAPSVLRQLDLRRQLNSRHLATTVLGLRISPISPRVIELSCSFQAGQRVFPLAMRVEQQADRWLVTACEIGPH